MKKGERRKRELLEIAYRMFLSRGYENTSVDEIIDEAGIAKGTYYYYFESKEQTLEEVIGMMLEKETQAAESIVEAPMPVAQKIVGIIASIRRAPEEKPIEGALMRPENILMHQKIKRKLVEKVVPILSRVVEEGVEQGAFCCGNIPERVRMMLVLSNEVFDKGNYTDRDVDVFIDVTEKLLGAQAHALDFLRELILAAPSGFLNAENKETEEKR